MTRMIMIWVGILAGLPLPATGGGDASRGALHLESLRCTSCHRFNGLWDSAGLGKLFKTRLSPTRLAGAVWSHAPKMWNAAPSITAEQSADLMAYFFAAGYFERIGDARRGAARFLKLQCAKCHPDNEVARWTIIASPSGLLAAMWVHAPRMKTAMETRELTWPSVSEQDMRDILAYVAARTGKTNHLPQIQFGAADRGEMLFNSKQCASCHQGPLALTATPVAHSLTETAASLWNHAPMLTRTSQTLNAAQLSDLLAYLWSLRYFDELGNATRGSQVFTAKGCASCHNNTPRNPLTAATALQAIWQHAPGAKGGNRNSEPWPLFVGDEFADLLAFWNRTASKTQ